MSMFFGNNAISDIYFGDKKVEKIYWGANKIYEAAAPTTAYRINVAINGGSIKPKTLLNGQMVNYAVTSMEAIDTVTLYFLPNTGYDLPQTITVDGYTGVYGDTGRSNVNWEYRKAYGALSLSGPIGDMTINITCVRV